jgi:hypothetical protein
MGEMADYLINGDDCESCGQYIGEGDGFSRSCCDKNHPNYMGDDFESDNEDLEEGIKLSDIDTNIRILHHELIDFRESHSDEMKNLTQPQKDFLTNLEKLLNDFFNCEDE